MPTDQELIAKRESSPRQPTESEEKLLIQIREDFAYFSSYWADNKKHARECMRYAAGQFWDPGEEQQREGQPCLNPDEISEFVKQYTNNLRQSKRAIKFNPRGTGATDKDAEHRANIIRGIEYASNAQSAYIPAAEQAAWSGYGGFWRLSIREYDKGKMWPCIKRIPNQFSVLHDPDAKEADFSDARKVFVVDQMRLSDYLKSYKNARIRSFSADDMKLAPEWFPGQNIVVAEYWIGEGGTPGRDMKVTQYITNGLEILDETVRLGTWIPIVGVWGEELYVEEGGVSRRKYLSLISRALTAQKMLAYTASAEAQEFRMMPRAPIMGYKGQFDPEQMKDLHERPRAYVEFNPAPANWNPAWGPA